MTILVTLAIVSVFALAVWLAYRSNQRHARALEQFAAQYGWAYARTDTLSLKPALEALFPGTRFNPANIMTVGAGTPAAVVLFECSYRAIGGPAQVALGSGALVGLKALGSNQAVVEVIARSALDRVTLGAGIDLGDPEFGERYLVYSEDPRAAERLVHSELRRVLMERAGEDRWARGRINIGPGGIALLIGSVADLQEWPHVLAFAREIAGAFSAYSR